MMPLTFAKVGEEVQVLKVNGQDETRHFLEKLGFVQGARVQVISEISGNLIVNVKETRVAIDRKMAGRIMV